MGYHLGPIATQDQYVNQVKLDQGVECARLNFWVSNNPIFYQYRYPDDSNWSTDIYIPSTTGLSFFVSVDRKCRAVQARSAIAGSPAIITMEMVPASEIPD